MSIINIVICLFYNYDTALSVHSGFGFAFYLALQNYDYINARVFLNDLVASGALLQSDVDYVNSIMPAGVSQ